MSLERRRSNGSTRDAAVNGNRTASKTSGSHDADAEAGAPRSKKSRLSKALQASPEADAQVSDAVDAQDKPQGAVYRNGSSKDHWLDPEAGIAESARPMWADYDADTADHDFDEWRKSLEELRREQRPEARFGDPAAKPSQDELARRLKKAIRDNDWSLITAPAALASPAILVAAVQQLSAESLPTALQGLASRWTARPRERPQTSNWLLQILKRRGETMVGKASSAEVLRPFLRLLALRLGHDSQSGKVLSCLGKWRMAVGLAVARRDVRSRAVASKRAPAKASEPVPSEDDDDKEDEDEDDDAAEEEDDDDEEPQKKAKSASQNKAAASDSDDE